MDTITINFSKILTLQVKCYILKKENVFRNTENIKNRNIF